MPRFQSTLPVRGATTERPEFEEILIISIHAPREGSDAVVSLYKHWSLGISIHAPREGSDGGACDVVHGHAISIHAPREGSDREVHDPEGGTQ